MRTTLCILLLACVAGAEDLPVERLAGVSLQVADLEKTRQFYTGIWGLEEAFDIKDASGAVRSAFFKINDEQYLEFSPASVDGFRLDHFSLLTSDLKGAAAALRQRGVEPGTVRASADGAPYFAIRDPEQNEIRFVHYAGGSQEAGLRGKALGVRRVSISLQHMGIPADNHDADFAFYTEKLGFHDLFLGGPNPPEIRWINLGIAGTPPDIFELMILASQPQQGRRHIAFEVSNMQSALKELQARGIPAQAKANPGPPQNPRWILNLRDPNGLRVEVMGELVAK